MACCRLVYLEDKLVIHDTENDIYKHHTDVSHLLDLYRLSYRCDIIH